MTAKLPSWHREANELGIDYLVLVYEKAEGFVFCPRNRPLPFRVGGDYGGNFEVTADGALDHYERCFNRGFDARVAWFIPFVRRVAKNQDFSLRDLKLESRTVKVIRGKWPW
jgi:hypothetical protein